MVEKRNLLRYFLVGIVIVVLLVILLGLRVGYTGHVIYDDSGGGLEENYVIDISSNSSDYTIARELEKEGCESIPNSCGSFFSQSSCELQAGCNWKSADCFGDCSPCLEIKIKDLCENHQGCLWDLEGPCSGLCNCSSVNLSYCNDIFGCTLEGSHGEISCEGSCSCYSLSKFQCLDTSCKWESAGCEGVCIPCYSFGTESACNFHSGCSWRPGVCNGVPDICNSFFSQSSCELQAGCNWNEKPLGVESSSLEKVISISKVEEIISKPGSKKTLILNVKNSGEHYLNNCKLVIEREISDWFYSTQKQGIAPGQNIEFIFNLNVPEGVLAGNYLGVLQLSCDELNESQDVVVSVIAGLNLIYIDEITYEKNKLKLNYVFNTSRILGDYAEIEIWIVDEEGNEIERIKDSFLIEDKNLIYRSILIETSGDLIGIYQVYLALSSDLNNFIEQSIVLGKSTTTGNAIFNTFRGNVLGYIVFIFIIAITIFFYIWKRHKSPLDNNEKLKVKNKQLLRS